MSKVPLPMGRGAVEVVWVEGSLELYVSSFQPENTIAAIRNATA